MSVASRMPAWFSGCAAIAALALGAATPSLADEPRTGRIGSLSGTVSVHTAGQTKWIAAVSERALAPGDGVWTQPGARARVELGGAAIELQEQTQLELAHVTALDAALRLVQGTLDVRVAAFGPGESWQVETPRGSVRLMQPGSFLIEAGAGEQPTRVTVIAGAAQMVGTESGLIVTAGQTGVVTGVDGGLSYAIQLAPPTRTDLVPVDSEARQDPDAQPDQPR